MAAMDFWQLHGVLFLACVFFFPRLTLLLSDVMSGGLLWWLGWLIAPRILVACLATLHYVNTNPILVILSWCWALSGESAEKHTLRLIYRKNF